MVKNIKGNNNGSFFSATFWNTEQTLTLEVKMIYLL